MTHYERLGIEPTASADEVRFAYRRLARLHHPDAGGGHDSAEMAELNAAWRALSDPGRRRMYDASLRDGSVRTAASTARPTESQKLREEHYPVERRSDEPLKFPFRWMIIVGLVVMVLIVVAGNIVSGGTKSPTSRGMLRAGSCLKVLENFDVSVVDCAEPHDGITISVVAFDQICPADLEMHRDRQGLGFACMQRQSGPPAT